MSDLDRGHGPLGVGGADLGQPPDQLAKARGVEDVAQRRPFPAVDLAETAMMAVHQDRQHLVVR